jgi:dimethylglycine catabolism A
MSTPSSPSSGASPTRVHAHGVPIIAELVPGMGRMGKPGPGRPIISASAINVRVPEEYFPKGVLAPGGLTTGMPQEASIAEIEQYEREMVDAAERVHRAGWDGVEVGAHMSYFAASFLSPKTNWRTDRYGGSVENRARMLVNIVAGIRRRLGRDFVVGLRITANDYTPEGQEAETFAAIAKRVEAEGIDYVALSTGCYERLDMSVPTEDGALVDSGDASIFKRMLSTPVLLQGVHDPVRAAEALAGGHGDMIMFARPLLADPEYAQKVCQDRMDDIVRCNRDNLCFRRLIFGMPVRCAVNPAMGRESRGKRLLPPADRLVKAPVERAVLGLTGSKRLMGLVSAVMKKRAARLGDTEK